MAIQAGGLQRGVPEGECVHFRMGVHFGKVSILPTGAPAGDDIATLLQSLADAGRMYISRPLHAQVKILEEFSFENLAIAL